MTDISENLAQELARQKKLNADRQRRWREREKQKRATVTLRNVTRNVTAPTSSFLEKNVDDDETRARARTIAGKGLSIFGMTWDEIMPGWCGFAGWIEGELRGSGLLETDVIEAALVVRRKRPGFVPASFRYLIAVIREAKDNRQRELPLLRVMEAGNGKAVRNGGANGDLASALAEAKQWVTDVRAETEAGDLCGPSDETDRIATTRFGR